MTHISMGELQVLYLHNFVLSHIVQLFASKNTAQNWVTLGSCEKILQPEFLDVFTKPKGIYACIYITIIRLVARETISALMLKVQL